MVLKTVVALIALVLAWSATRAAEALPAAAASIDASSCELHVWPASGITVAIDTSDILFRSPAVITQVGYDIHRQLLPDSQNRVFASMDLPQLLGVPGAKLIQHETALPTQDQRDNTRRAASHAACYAELIVSKLLYAEGRLGARQVEAIFLFRRFEAGPSPVREFSQSGETSLHIFPPHNQEPVAPALAELVAAFRSDVVSFGGKLTTLPAMGGH